MLLQSTIFEEAFQRKFYLLRYMFYVLQLKLYRTYFMYHVHRQLQWINGWHTKCGIADSEYYFHLPSSQNFRFRLTSKISCMYLDFQFYQIKSPNTNEAFITCKTSQYWIWHLICWFWFFDFVYLVLSTSCLQLTFGFNVSINIIPLLTD